MELEAVTAWQKQEPIVTSDEARSVVLFEGRPQDDKTFKGLWIEARDGPVPTQERMYRLLTALRTLFEALDGQPTLDRVLCSALWALGTYVPQMYRGSPIHGVLREGFDDELQELEGRISNIFEGVWQEWISLPGFEEDDSGS